MNLIKRIIDKVMKKQSKNGLVSTFSETNGKLPLSSKDKIQIETLSLGSFQVNDSKDSHLHSQFKVTKFSSKKTYQKYKSQQKNWSKWKRRK